MEQEGPLHRLRPRLDRLAALAVRLLDAPIAWITLSEDVAGTAGTPPDRVGAVAAVPLPLPEGPLTGQLCVAAAAGREWTADETATIGDLATAAGSIVGAALTSSELTEARLRADRQQAYLEGLVERLDVGLAATDRDGRIVLMNGTVRAMVGARADPSLALKEWVTRYEVTFADGRPVDVAELGLMRAFEGADQAEDEIVVTVPDGRRRDLHLRSRRIEDPTGALLGGLMLVEDVTDERRAARLRHVLAGRPWAGAAADDLRTVVESLGWCRAELWIDDAITGGLTLVARWSAEGRDPEIDLQAAQQPGTGLAHTVRERDAPLWLVAGTPGGGPQLPPGLSTGVGVPVPSGGGAAGALCVFAETLEAADDTVVSLLSGAAARLGEHLQHERASALAQELRRTKDDYVELVGHEMRTPLTSAMSFTELLAETPDAAPFAEVRPLLEIVERNLALLRDIVEELIELAALDSGHTTLQLAPVEIGALARRAMEGVDGAVDCPAPLTVEADPEHLRQVVEQLVGNAVRYSPDGGAVTVTVGPRDGWAELSVRDHGIGIPADERERVFERFFRGRQARELGIPGTGLGLARSRLVVERHRGTVTLTGPDDGGTLVVVRLPLA